MEVNTNKIYKTYQKLSRYQSFPVYYSKLDEKYSSGITDWLKDDTPYINHTVVEGNTLDSLALYYYNNPTRYWIIADFNRILDVFQPLEVGSVIKIPTLSDIDYKYGV